MREYQPPSAVLAQTVTVAFFLPVMMFVQKFGARVVPLSYRHFYFRPAAYCACTRHRKLGLSATEGLLRPQARFAKSHPLEYFAFEKRPRAFTG
eukprot:1460901-Rhodomonas_salina.3